jgi:hypothetical protein
MPYSGGFDDKADLHQTGNIKGADRIAAAVSGRENFTRVTDWHIVLPSFLRLCNLPDKIPGTTS